MGSKKRLLTSKKPKKGANLLRYDPSRTNGLRRQFSAEVNRRFRKLRMAVIDLVDKQDAFGLRDREPLSFNCQPGQIRNEKGQCGPGIGVEIPRDQMPQIKAEDLDEFYEYAANRGTYVAFLKRPADDLSPTQSKFRQERVDAIPQEKLGEEPIIISSDDYILDGTHRWVKAWQQGKDTLVYVAQLDKPLQESLALMRGFPKAKFVANANPYHDALGRFAAGVEQAAKDSPTGKFGDHKTFISHVHAEYNKGQQAQGKLGQSLEQFKGNLIKAQTAGLVSLARADLPHLMNAKDIGDSHIAHSNANFHFVTHNFNPDQPRDSDGKFAGGGGTVSGPQGVDTSPRGLMDHVKALGGKIGHAEHLAKVYVSDKIGAAVGKLPLGAQKGVLNAFGVARFGTAAAFATWKAGQNMAERVAKERGATDEEARRLRGVLSGMDVATFKPITFALHSTGLHAATLGAVSMIPPASVGYLAYSTARDPMATLRAATGVVKDAAKGLGKVGQKLYDSKFNTALVLNADSLHNVMLLEDALRQHNYDDWYIALLSVAMDAADNFEEALKVADRAWEKKQDARRPPIVNSFCATGPGGGIDPSCSPGEGGLSLLLFKDYYADLQSDNPKGVAHLSGLKIPETPAEAKEIATALRKSIKDSFGPTKDHCRDATASLKALFPSVEVYTGVYPTNHPNGGFHYIGKLGHYFMDVTADQFGGGRVNVFTQSDRDKGKFSEYDSFIRGEIHGPKTQGSGEAIKAITFLKEDRAKKAGKLVRNTNAGRFAFDSDPEKLAAFQEWLKQQFLGYLAGATEEQLWAKFIMEGFKKGAGRAYDDYYTKSRWDPGKGDFYAGSKKQFLQSSFAQPEAVGKVKLLAARSFDELENVTADMSNKMSRVLTSGLVRGMNPHDIAREMADEIDIGQNRATVIARTEIVRAHAEGQLQAFEAMGVEELGVMVEWSTAGDERVCDDCEPMEGVVLKLDEAKGMIPRHPQCRCAFIPANVGEDQENQQRTKGEITGAIKESRENAGDTAEDWGPGKAISKERPESVLNSRTYTDGAEILSNFLATNYNPDEPRDEKGEWTSGGGAGATGSNKTDKSKFIGASVGWQERAHADQLEKHVATVLGLEHESNYKFYDAKSKNNKDFVEVKSMLKGQKQAINAHADALLRKVEGMADYPGAKYHTVAIDSRDAYEGGQHSSNYSGHSLYYKRGNGRYALSEMHPVKSEAELKRLVKMKDEDLPEKAKGGLPSSKQDVAKLRQTAVKEAEGRKARDANRRAKAKAEGRNIYERQT